MSRLNDEGLVRAAARQILINDIKAGKIKNITVSEAIKTDINSKKIELKNQNITLEYFINVKR